MFNNSQTGSTSLELDVIICAPIFLVNTAIITSFDFLDAGHSNCDKISPAIYNYRLHFVSKSGMDPNKFLIAFSISLFAITIDTSLINCLSIIFCS